MPAGGDELRAFYVREQEETHSKGARSFGGGPRPLRRGRHTFDEPLSRRDLVLYWANLEGGRRHVSSHGAQAWDQRERLRRRAALSGRAASAAATSRAAPSVHRNPRLSRARRRPPQWRQESCDDADASPQSTHCVMRGLGVGGWRRVGAYGNCASSEPVLPGVHRSRRAYIG